jgi:hypothetical protein
MNEKKPLRASCFGRRVGQLLVDSVAFAQELRRVAGMGGGRNDSILIKLEV